MIVIKKPQIKTMDGKVRISAGIDIPEETYRMWVRRVSSLKNYKWYEKIYKYNLGIFELWYEVEEQYASCLCCERADAFVLAVLYFAMLTGEDIQSEGAVSNEFLHNINTYLIPLHCNGRSGFRSVKVTADSTSERLESHGENGTGVSCGVDSFDTILTYMSPEMDKEHRLSVLTVFNVGAYDRLTDLMACIRGEKEIKACREQAEEWFQFECIQGKEIAKELGVKFLSVDSNLNELYQGMFLQSHSFRNCSAVLAVQKLFSHYYYASAGKPQDIIIDLLDDATGDGYLHFFSNETTRFYLGGMEKNRLEKMQGIIDYPIVQKYLHVCSEKKYNCAKCGKCGRTLLSLAILDRLDEFRPLFGNRSEIDTRMRKRYVWMLDQKKNDQYAADIYNYARENHVKIPVTARLYHLTYPLRKIARKFFG